MDRRRRVRLGAQRDDAAHAPVVWRSPDGFGRRLHHHTLSLGLPAWHLPRPRTASSAAVATRRVTSPGRVASSLDASALCPARPLPTRPGPGRQPSAAGSRARLPDSAATGDPAAFGSLCLRHLAHHPLVGSSRIPPFLSAADGAALHTLPASSSSVHPPAAAAAVARGRRRRERGGRGPLPEAVVSFPSDPYPGAGVLGRTGVLPVVLRGNAPPSPSLAPLRRRLFRTVFPVLSRRSEGQDPDPLCPTRRHHHSASQCRRTVCLGKETCKSGRFVGATGPKRGERVPWPAGPRAPFKDLGPGRTPLPSGQVDRARVVMRTTCRFSPTHALVPRGFPSATSGPFSG